jgi:hypothetical protein
MNSARIQVANWTKEKDTLAIDSRVTLKFGDKPVDIKSREVWSLQKRGKKLVINQTADGFMGRGPSSAKLVYNKF